MFSWVNTPPFGYSSWLVRSRNICLHRSVVVPIVCIYPIHPVGHHHPLIAYSPLFILFLCHGSKNPQGPWDIPLMLQPMAPWQVPCLWAWEANHLPQLENANYERYPNWDYGVKILWMDQEFCNKPREWIIYPYTHYNIHNYTYVYIYGQRPQPVGPTFCFN